MPMLASRAAAALRNWGYSGTTLILRLRDTYWKYVTLLLRGNNADIDTGLSAAPDVLAFNRDASSNNFALTLAGDTKPSVYNPYQAGYYSCFFDGTGDFLTSPGSTAFTFGTDDFTVEYWVYHTAVAATYNQHVGAATTSAGFAFGNNGTALKMYMTTSTVGYTSTGTSFVLNRWHHAAYCRQNGTVTFFLDGAVNYSTAAATNITETNFGLGAAPSGTSYPMTGYLSNVRVVKRQALYTVQFTPSTGPLKVIGNTSLLACQANRLVDISPASNTLTKNGDVSVRQANPFVASYSATIPSGYSVYFDGSGNDNLTVATSTAFGMGTGDFTVEFWTYWTGFLNTLNGGAFVDFRNYPDAQAFVIYLHTNGVLRYYDGPANTEYDSGVTLTSGRWHYIALTRATGVWRLFLNGTLIKTHTNASDLGSTKPVRIGQGAHAIIPTAGTDYKGFISNFRVIKGQALYTDTFTVPTSALTAVTNTSLLTCQDFVVKDNSTNAFAVTPGGDAVTSSLHPFGDPATVRIPPSYYGVSFDGNGDYISTAANATFALGTSSFTIECWYYAASKATNYPTVFGNQTGANVWTTNYWGLYDRHNTNPTKLSLWVYNYNTGAAVIVSNLTVTNGIWYHVVLQRNGSTFTLFINGAVDSTYTNATAIDGGSSQQFTIGVGGDSTTYFNGTVSSLRLVKGAALYTTTFTPSITPLTAVSGTALLTCQSATIIDGSGNAFAITAVGDAKPVYVNLAEAATSIDTSSYGSAYFDGTGDYIDVASSSAFAFGTGDFTIEFWAYPSAAPATSWTPFLTMGFSGGGQEIRISQNINGTGFGYLIPNAAGNADVYVGFGTMPINQWSHMALVRYGSTVTLYRNGLSVGSTTSVAFNFTNTTLFRIGGSQTAYTDGTVQGYISDVRIVKGQALYTINFIPPVSPLTTTSQGATSTAVSLLTLQTRGALTNNFFPDVGHNNLLVTKNGNVGQSTFTPAGGGWSVYFDGSGDYLSFTTTTPMVLGTSAFTIEAWVYPTSYAHAFFIIENRVYNSIGTGTWYFYITASGQLIFDQLQSVGTIISTASSAVLLNIWTHVAVVRNSSNVWYMYVNGVSSGTTTPTDAFNFSATNTTYIGYNSDTNVWSAYGYISNLRVVKGTAVYTSNFTPSITPLTLTTDSATAYTSLLTCNDSYLKDWSFSNNTITKSGDARIERRNPFGNYRLTSTGNSYLFAGSGSYLVAADTIDMYAQPITIEGWLYPTTAGYAPIVEENTGGSNGEQLMYISSSQFVVFEQRNTHGYGATIALTSTATAPINTWTHFALCLTISGPRIYINGVQSATDATVRYWNNAGRTFSIGLNGYGGTGFPGYISNLRVSKGVRYTATFTPSTTTFVADSATSFLTCSSTLVEDSSYSKRTITMTGTIKPSEFNPFGYTNVETDSVPTSVGTSLNFDGTGDYLSIPNNTNFDFGTGDFTVEFWLYAINMPNTAGIVGKKTGDATNGWQIYHNTSVANGRLSARLTLGNDFSSTSSFSLNIWEHWALTRSGTSVRWFKNGVLDFTGTSSANISDTTTLNIGYSQTWGGYYTGYISGLRVLAGFARYTTSFVPSRPILPAPASYSLALNPTTVGIYDSAGTVGFSTEGNSTLSVAQKKYGSSSLYFDGTGDYLLFNMVERILPMQTWATGTWTWECWVYQIARHTPSSSWDWPTMCCGPGGYMTMGLTSTGKLRLQWYIGGSGGERRATGTATVALATWTHIAICVTAGAIKFFINGVQDTYDGTYTNSQSTILNNPAVTTGTFLIGGGSGYGDFNGYMDDLRIHNGYARYTSNFDPPAAMVAAGPLT